MDLSVKIGPLTLRNPVTLASGTAGYGEELSKCYDISRLGAIFTKGLSLLPRAGNKGNRIIETHAGMLNSIGLENVGLECFLNEKMPFLISKNATVIPNVAGHTIEENVELCRELSEAKGIAGLELNVSCPNVKEGGLAFGSNMKSFKRLLKKVRPAAKLPLIVKLSPNTADVAEFAEAARALGADAVSAVNTFLGMKIDIDRGKPHFENKVAGLSGPAIRPLAVRLVYEIFERVKIPIIGIGGICEASDAIEFLMAGACAVSIGTMNLINPAAAMDCLGGLESYMKEKSIQSVEELIGIAHRA